MSAPTKKHCTDTLNLAFTAKAVYPSGTNNLLRTDSHESNSELGKYKQLVRPIQSPNVSKNVSRLTTPNIINIVAVNTQYVSDSMRCVIAQNKRVFVWSDMGTGKTFGMADAITDAMPHGVVIVVTHLTSLVKGNEARLTSLLKERGVSARIAHYSDSNPVDVADAQLIFTTLHSLHSVIDSIGGAGRVSLAMFDESESVAQIMTADIMDKSRERVANALDELSVSGCKLVMLDAHLSNSTYAFCNAYLSGEWVMLDNQYQRWAGNTYQWVRSSENDNHNAEKDGLLLLGKQLECGKKVFVTSGSRAQAERIYNYLKKAGLIDNLSVLKAWADGGSQELQECKDNHDLFNDYGLVIATPSVGTGISIEPRNGEPNFDCVVSFIVRHKSTPDAVSAMQMPFRVRKTQENKIWLVKCDYAPDSLNGLPEFVIQRDVKKQIELATTLINQHTDAIENPDIRKLIFSTYAGFAGAIALHKSDLWGNFWGTINDEFARKGIVRDDDYLGLPSKMVKAIDKQARLEAKEAAVLKLFEANDLHQEQAAAIEVKARFGNTVSAADKLALEKHKLVSYYANDDYNPLDLKAFKGLKAMQNRGYMAGCNRAANGQLPLPEINKIMKAWAVTGTRQKDATSMDAVRIKAEWKLDRILCDVVGLSCTDGVYQITATTVQAVNLTTKEGRGRGSYTRLLSEIIDDWNATHTDQRLNRKLLQDDAVIFVGKLLSSRLKLDVKYKDGFISVADKQPTIDLLNKHSARGAVGLAKLVQAIDTEQAANVEQTQAEQPKKKGAVEVLKQAWVEAGKPCHFDDVLNIFLPYRAEIEDDNGYSVEALITGIRANFGAGNLRVA